MQVKLLDGLLEEGDARRAEQVLNACVHCGFCTATCPTYLLAGNELDSPRGRIYLVKEMLETGSASELTRTHLDRCLTCRSCETTCPSGVEYHKLVAIGRETVERLAPRNFFERSLRGLLRKLMLSPRIFGGLLAVGRLASPLLPASLRRTYFPPQRSAPPQPTVRVDTAAVILLPGCVQPLLRPDIDSAFARILRFFDVPLLQPRAAGCCGAVSQHTSAEGEARELARRNIDSWWPLVRGRQVRAIVSTATGCGAQLQDYPLLLAGDPHYAARARALAELLRDPVELLEELQREQPRRLPKEALTGREKYAFHCPCTLQHGLGLNGRVERLLAGFGVQLPPVKDAHLCCGSAGTYSILQPRRSRELRRRKLANLQASEPQTILTANIGCLLHLQGGTDTPVRHWLELLADALPETE